MALARQSCDELSIAAIVVIDDMDNTVRKAYGKFSNSAYFIARGGVIVHKDAWALPDVWRERVRELLGEGREP